MAEGTYRGQRFEIGQHVRYRVRRLAIHERGPSRRGRPAAPGERFEFGEGVVRAVDPRAPCTTYDVALESGELVRFDGIGLYEHELQALP